MSALTNIVKKACLMMTGILMASTVKAAEPSTSSFDMEANGIAYRIFTAAPQEVAPEGGYPVIYMVDGNRMLPIAAKLMAENSALKAIFVGIGYPTDNQEEIVRLRYFDLTPPTPDDLIPVHFNVPKTGGRDAFFDFIDNQVKPEVEKRFNVDKADRPCSATLWADCSPFMPCSTAQIPSRAIARQTRQSGGTIVQF